MSDIAEKAILDNNNANIEVSNSKIKDLNWKIMNCYSNQKFESFEKSLKKK